MSELPHSGLIHVYEFERDDIRTTVRRIQRPEPQVVLVTSHDRATPPTMAERHGDVILREYHKSDRVSSIVLDKTDHCLRIIARLMRAALDGRTPPIYSNDPYQLHPKTYALGYVDGAYNLGIITNDQNLHCRHALRGGEVPSCHRWWDAYLPGGVKDF